MLTWITAIASGLATAFLMAPPMGTDLAAQQARADFANVSGVTPIDFRWYGGTQQFGYSLISQFTMAVLSPRVTGAVAMVVSSVAFAYLLVRCGARHPLLGGVLGAVVAAANLVSGRITFALGLAFGMLALAALVVPALPRTARSVIAGLLAALTSWASPLAGLFVCLAGIALLLGSVHRSTGGQWRIAHLAGGLTLSLGSGLALIPMTLVSDGGTEPYSRSSMRVSVVLVLAVAVLVPGSFRVVRIGALMLAGLIVGAYLVPSPIGYNATRLSLLYGLPVLAALATFDGRDLAAVLAVLVWWQPPLGIDDLMDAGSPASRSTFYQPLDRELSGLGPIGRVEVVPLRDHWESVYVASVVPLARGWERQADVARNPLFYTPTLDANSYARWLRDQAVSYVALARGSRVEFHGRTEAAIVRADLPFLRQMWSDRNWRLYAVIDPTAMVSPPARLIRSTADRVEFEVPAAGDVLVRVRWSRWLTVRGARLAPGADGWTSVRLPAPGRYVLSSSLVP